MRAHAHRPLPPVIPFLAFLLAGCGDTGDTPAGPEPQDDAIPTELTDPVEVIQSLARAWNEMDYAALEALLAPDFQFCVLDPSDFPWLAYPCWGKTEELEVAQNMFDPLFAGSFPPVQSILVDFTVLDAAEPATGTHVLPADAVITVLTGPNDGINADTRVIFTIVKQPDGFLRVQKIQEIAKLQPLRGGGESPGIEKASWSSIKALYFK